MDDFVANIDRRTVLFERQFDDADCPVNTCTKPPRGGKEQVQGGLLGVLFSHLQCHLGNRTPMAKAFPRLQTAKLTDKDTTPVQIGTVVEGHSLMRKYRFAVPLAFALVAGCASDGELDVSSGVGVTATRTGCPVVAVPEGTGDITLFSNSGQNLDSVDVVASITKLRPNCNSSGERIYSAADFEVLARRSDPRGARSVTLPYFSTIVQGGNAVVAKRVGKVTINFADGQDRASATGKAASYIDATSARLPEDIVAKITKKRRPGDADAALDPMADPEVKAAVQRASFEMLVGFQLTEEQLRYNVTR